MGTIARNWVRRAVAAGLAIMLTGCAHIPGMRHRPARLAGALWWVTPADLTRTEDQWRRDLDSLQALGMNVLVLNGPFIGGAVPPGKEDPALRLIEETDRRGMTVFLDTLSAPNWWAIEDPAEELARARTRIQLLHEQYGHLACFKGYYIPYELYVMWDEQADLIRTLYREVAASCKQTAPTKAVLISPFFILDKKGYLGDFRWATPKEYRRFWRETLDQADIDVVALQDSGEHLSCYTLKQRAPFFKAMRNACNATDTQLWANVETGELLVDSMTDYVDRFGLKTHVNDPKTTPAWRGVPADKLLKKLRFCGKYSPMAITWGYREFARPALGEEASELYLDYYVALSGQK